jgi:hypothetical protein
MLEPERLERLARLAREAQSEYSALLRLADAAIAAADRREVGALVASLDACDAKQRFLDPVIRELSVAREALRTAEPTDAGARASLKVVDELLRPVTTLGTQVMASYERLRDRTTLGRTEIGREMEQLRQAETVRSAYRPASGERSLNLVR